MLGWRPASIWVCTHAGSRNAGTVRKKPMEIFRSGVSGKTLSIAG